MVQEVFGLCAVPSGAEADEQLQTRKRRTRKSTGILIKRILKPEEGGVPDGHARGWKVERERDDDDDDDDDDEEEEEEEENIWYRFLGALEQPRVANGPNPPRCVSKLSVTKSAPSTRVRCMMLTNFKPVNEGLKCWRLKSGTVRL